MIEFIILFAFSHNRQQKENSYLYLHIDGQCKARSIIKHSTHNLGNSRVDAKF
jgi:hypothetical protein